MTSSNTARAPLLLAALALTASAARADDFIEDLLIAQAPPLVSGDTLAFAARELGQERVVKGAPYCADAVHETVQWLPDPGGGAPNRIVRQQATKLCRDGEGRTRQEIERQGRKLVYLRDPVAGENWVLDPAAKTARRLGAASMATDSAAWREYGDKLREWTREFTQRRTSGAASAAVPPVPPAPPLPAWIDHGDRSDREVRVLRIDPGMATLPTPPALPPAVAWRASEMAPRGAGVSSPLGSKDIEGVRASGERTTWTIAAGRVGNEKPIVIVREVWTAPDLMLTLSTRDFDPRSAETLYRLQNLKRGEPDAALMKVPGDYAQRTPTAPRASSATG